MAKKKKRTRLRIENLPITISISDEPLDEQRLIAAIEACWEHLEQYPLPKGIKMV